MSTQSPDDIYLNAMARLLDAMEKNEPFYLLTDGRTLGTFNSDFAIECIAQLASTLRNNGPQMPGGLSQLHKDILESIERVLGKELVERNKVDQSTAKAGPIYYRP